MVSAFRKLQFPKFSGCALNADKPHYYRMVAFDAISGIDKLLESINSQLSSRPGEHTREYLQRIKAVALPDLDDELIVRLAFMHDWCRFVTEMEFGGRQLEEVQHHVTTLSKLLDANSERLASLQFSPPTSTFYVEQEPYEVTEKRSSDWHTRTPNEKTKSYEQVPLLEQRSSASRS